MTTKNSPKAAPEYTYSQMSCTKSDELFTDDKDIPVSQNKNQNLNLRINFHLINSYQFGGFRAYFTVLLVPTCRVAIWGHILNEI